jgi:uncharacterized protein GlcG (DUF336 family)
MGTRKAFTAVALTAGIVLAPATAAVADPGDCDAYSETCVKPRHIVKPPTEVEGTNTTLPFTGGEILLMTVAAGGAIGVGGAMVVSARRRRNVAI